MARTEENVGAVYAEKDRISTERDQLISKHNDLKEDTEYMEEQMHDTDKNRCMKLVILGIWF